MIFKAELSIQSNWQQLSGPPSMKSCINFNTEHYWQDDWNSVVFHSQVRALQLLQPASLSIGLHGTLRWSTAVPALALG